MTNGLAPTITETGQTRWQNWHENYRVPVRRLVDVWNGDPNAASLDAYRATTAGLQRLIGESLEAGERIRALGGGWSFSRAPVTDGTLVNTKPLNYQFPIQPDSVHPDYPGNRENLYLVQCGNAVAELNRLLSGVGKSLRTSGASNGQTIAGAVSTGTHGAAVDAGAMCDFVEAIHLVPSPDRHVWLERASRPAVTDTMATDLVGAELIRDDELFNAVLVSFGSFGIIHGLVIEADDQYFLNAYRQRMPLAALREALDDLDFGRLTAFPRPEDRPWHFQAVVNPFEPGQAYVTTMYRDAARREGSRLPDPPSAITHGDDAFAVVAFLTDTVTALTPVLGAGLASLGYGEFENVSGTPGQIFRDTTTRGRAASTAMGLPLGHVNEALDTLLRLQDDVEAPVLFALRYVRATQATLGFTYHEPRTCVLEIDGPRSGRVQQMYRKSWAALRSLGFPLSFHWGKQHDLTEGMVRAGYGDARVDAWLDGRRRLLDAPALLHAFSNATLKQMNLHA